VERGDQAGEWEADYVEVAAFNARDVASGAPLDSVGTGFVVGLAGGEIHGDFLRGERIEVDLRGLDELEVRGVWQADKRDAGENGMSAAGELLEHVVGVIGGAWFTEDFVVEDDDGVGGDDNGWANGARGDEFGFGVGEAEDESVGRFVGRRRFVHSGGEYGKRNASVAQDFGPAWGGRGEDEFHVRPFERRIVQGVLGNGMSGFVRC
jgi:hypothetical protein